MELHKLLERDWNQYSFGIPQASFEACGNLAGHSNNSQFVL